MAENCLLELADGRVGVIRVEQGQEHVCLDSVLRSWSTEQSDYVHAVFVKWCGFVQDHAERVGYPVEVVAHLPFGRGCRGTRLIEDALGCPHVVGVGVDVHVVLDDLGVRLGAQHIGMHKREMAHV